MSKRIKTDYPGVYYYLGKRSGGRGQEKIYYITFKKDGRNIEEPVGRQYRDNMTPAKASGIRTERIEGKRQSPKEIRERAKKKKSPWTIEKIWDEYTKQKKLKGFSSDKSRYEKYLRPTFGKKEPHEIMPLEVDRLRLKAMEGKSPQTVKLTLALLRRIVNFGQNKRLSKPLPFTIQMPTVYSEKTEDLSQDQLVSLLKAIEEDTHPQAGDMMKMVLYTGMRRGELFNLQWQDIDFERGFILIRDPKGGPSQKIPLNDAASELLKSIEKMKSTYVFPGRDGGKRTDIHRHVNRIRDKAGLPSDFRALHGLRHTYASMLASSGQVDMYALQRLMTHKDFTMTQRYAHLRDEALKKGADLAAKLINDAVKGETEDKAEEAGENK